MKPHQKYCLHTWVNTQGFTQIYTDCSKCGLKFEEYEQARKQESIEIIAENNWSTRKSDHLFDALRYITTNIRTMNLPNDK